MTIPEWGFDVTPEKVDLERIRRELDGVPAIYVYSYLGSLRTHAPQTYQRLAIYAIQTGWLKNSVQWDAT